MSRKKGHQRPSTALNKASGRTASPAELRRQLPSAPASYLEGALQNPELAAEEMVLLLRNRAATPSLLQRIWRDRRWTRYYEVKRGLAHHPRTPVPIARGLIHHLYWRDLAKAAEALHVHPSVRRQSEELLKVRLMEMTLGERISLARMASRALIASLRETGEERVLKALLGNSNLVELDAVKIASGEEVPGSVLGLLAGHQMWGARHAVRLALVTNPRTPIPVALRLLQYLPRRDLQRLAKDSRAPKIVRVGADRHLAKLARRRAGAVSRGRKPN